MTRDKHIDHIQTGQRVSHHSIRSDVFYFLTTHKNKLKFSGHKDPSLKKSQII